MEQGLLYALVGLGVYLSFRVLDFPDLTVDGSFPLGAAVTAVLIVQGVPPAIATFAGALAGSIAGTLTALLHVKLRILNLLASILVMIALYSINLRVMGRPNLALLGEKTLFSSLTGPWDRTLVLGAIVLGIKLLLDLFFRTELGLALRATGANPTMARAQGINTGTMIILGMALSNGLVGLAGGLFAQVAGFADAGLGVGTIVFGLAAVIVGETLGNRWLRPTGSAILGSLAYQTAITAALNSRPLGLQPQDLNLITAVIVTIALVLPNLKRPS
ncbi:MAG: ABC transporter permease [Alkalinema sp. RU_4_3]|nr:ABC transporter permease [Alkalinema sp. RU_4_3]